MLKKIKILLTMITLFIISLYTVHALTTTDPMDVINVVAVGSGGNCDVTAFETHLESAESGYLGQVECTVNPGYYLKNISVKFNNEDLKLGFEAGSETGNFLREYDFNPNEMLYQFIIPNDATEENKVEVKYEFAEKDAFDITYKSFNGNNYDQEVFDSNNYEETGHKLVEGYKDGDIVLPTECTDSGCLLELKFSKDTYDIYKNIRVRESEENEGIVWLNAEAFRNGDSLLFADQNEACYDDEDHNHICLVLVHKDFKDFGYGTLSVGYTKIHLFADSSVAFTVETDVENFNDILMETGSDVISFTGNKDSSNVELFYGTKKLTLRKLEPLTLVNTGEKNVGTVKAIDDVEGSGYGYTTNYTNGTLTVNIDTYYQDELKLELNILKNNTNVFGKKVNIKLLRFAFSGNGGQLLEVDSRGRNCHEKNNGNTCSQGVYYSTQYRGVLSSFYVANNATKKTLTSACDVDSIDYNNNKITLSDHSNVDVYERNIDFNPHALALFYDKNDMVVETRDFDLNVAITEEGYIRKSDFDSRYSNFAVTGEVKDYIFFGVDNRIRIDEIEYFKENLNLSIMHDLVLIGKDEAKNKGIVKIALFLVNGEVKENNIPALTYGTGEGKIMEIRGDE